MSTCRCASWWLATAAALLVGCYLPTEDYGCFMPADCLPGSQCVDGRCVPDVADTGGADAGTAWTDLAQVQPLLRHGVEGSGHARLVACDFDGNGQDDLLVAFPSAPDDVMTPGVGRVEIYPDSLWQESSTTAQLDRTTSSHTWVLRGASQESRVGAALGCARINDDAAWDVLLGDAAHDTWGAVVHINGRTLTGRMDAVGATTGEHTWQLTNSTDLGTVVAAGDLTGDGKAEVLMVVNGRLHVFRATDGLDLQPDAAAGAGHAVVEGMPPGTSALSVVHHDSRTAVAVLTSSGEVTLLRAQDLFAGVSVSYAALAQVQLVAGAAIRWVASADVDGTGQPDLLLGVPGATVVGGVPTGAVYVLKDSRADLASALEDNSSLALDLAMVGDRDVVLHGPPGSAFGYSVAFENTANPPYWLVGAPTFSADANTAQPGGQVFLLAPSAMGTGQVIDVSTAGLPRVVARYAGAPGTRMGTSTALLGLRNGDLVVVAASGDGDSSVVLGVKPVLQR